MAFGTFLRVAASCAVLVGAPAAAAVEIFFGENLRPARAVTGAPLDARNAFLGRLSDAGTENFERFANDASPRRLAFRGSAGTINATLAGDSEIRDFDTAGRFATSGDNYLRTNTNFSIAFDTPVAALGFYGTDFGDFQGQVTITLLRVGGLESFVVPATNDSRSGSLIFFGLIDNANPFTGFNFASNATADQFGIDDLTIGDAAQVASAVPEPATWAMMLLGFGAVGTSLRTRRRQPALA